MPTTTLPYLGYGLGLRSTHYQTILENQPPIDWFEVITEDYLVDGGAPLHYLFNIRKHYPMVMHGVSLSIGSVDPLNMTYLAKVKILAERLNPAWVSDHLCWTGVDGVNLHDLLPLPYTEEALQHVADRILQVQDFLGRQILIENVSSYITYKHSAMTEWEFLSEIAKRTDCLLLLDINNVYVSAFNHGFSAEDFLNGIPVERAQQFHVAGHFNRGDVIIDTHDAPVTDPVWDLYRTALKRFGNVSTLLERDDDIPPIQVLVDELAIARRIGEEIK